MLERIYAKTMNKEEAINSGLYNVIGKEIDDGYIEELKKLSLNPEKIKEQEDLKIGIGVDNIGEVYGFLENYSS